MSPTCLVCLLGSSHGVPELILQSDMASAEACFNQDPQHPTGHLANREQSQDASQAFILAPANASASACKVARASTRLQQQASQAKWAHWTTRRKRSQKIPGHTAGECVHTISAGPHARCLPFLP